MPYLTSIWTAYRPYQMCTNVIMYMFVLNILTHSFSPCLFPVCRTPTLVATAVDVKRRLGWGRRGEAATAVAAAGVAVFVVVRFTTTHQSPRGFRGCRWYVRLFILWHYCHSSLRCVLIDYRENSSASIWKIAFGDINQSINPCQWRCLVWSYLFKLDFAMGRFGRTSRLCSALISLL